MAKRYYDKKNMGTGKHANMPTEVVMKEYPKTDYLMFGDSSEDTLMGVDAQMNADVQGARKSKKIKTPIKY